MAMISSLMVRREEHRLVTGGFPYNGPVMKKGDFIFVFLKQSVQQISELQVI